MFRNYINFKGRAQRSEFWWFTLFTVIVSVVLGILGSALPALNVLEGIYSLAVLLPSLAVTVRRLHDTNRPAWWLLIYLAVFLAWVIGGIILAVSIGIDDPDVLETDFQDWPGYTAYIIGCILFSLAGAATMIIICAQRGTVGANRYGPDPHSANALPPTGAHWPQGGYDGPEHSANAFAPYGGALAAWGRGGIGRAAVLPAVRGGTDGGGCAVLHRLRRRVLIGVRPHPNPPP